MSDVVPQLGFDRRREQDGTGEDLGKKNLF